MDQIRQKLRIAAAAVHVPIGIEDQFKGVVDLVRWRAIYNEGVKGCVIYSYRWHRLTLTISVNVVESDEIPADILDFAKQKRSELIEAVAEVDEGLSDLYLTDSEITVPDLVQAIRRATISRKFSPVFLGSAIKNTGVQVLLDGVCAYLPNPSEAPVVATDLARRDPLETEDGKPGPYAQVSLIPAAKAPLVGLAFKLEEGQYGQLTYMRVYQGSLRKGGQIWNARTGKKIKVPRLVRMHSNEMEVRWEDTSIPSTTRTLCRTSTRLAQVKFAPSLE